jgi:hypothetical protein
MGGYTGARVTLVTLVAIDYLMTKGKKGGAKGSGKSGGALSTGRNGEPALRGAWILFSLPACWTTSLLDLIFNSHLNLQSFKSAFRCIFFWIQFNCF